MTTTTTSLSQRNRDDTAAYLAAYLNTILFIYSKQPNPDSAYSPMEIDTDVLAKHIRKFYDTLP